MVTFAQSLAGRVFLLAASIVALAVLIAVGVSGWIAARAADDSVREALTRASRVQRGFQDRRFEQLRLIARLFVSDPYVSAYFAEAAVSGDALSIVDLLEERQTDLGFDFAVALDPDGRVLARTGGPTALGADLSDEPLVRGALEEFEAYGIWRERDNLYYAVAVPLSAGAALTGFLIAGYAIDDLAALEMQQIGGTEVVFLAGRPGAVRIVASTLDDASNEELMAQLAAATETSAGAQLELTLGGRDWIAVEHPLADGSGSSTARVLSLVSMDAQMAPFRTMRRTIAVTGWVAMLLAATALLWLTRRALEPVARLSEAARLAVGGRFDTEVRVERQDEVGELADAFNQLLGELRETRDMIDYLAKISRSMPDTAAPLRAAPAVSNDEPTLAFSPAEGGGEPEDESTIAAGKPERFGERFELLAVLGEGGMGVVYKARDLALDDLVALKTLKRELRGQPQWQQLKEELKLARRITHPNVLRTYDFGNVDGVPFISMEYVRGVTLRYLLRKRGPLPISAGMHLARQLCRGLVAVHAEGIVHRDIKPGNVLVEASGNAKLMDFGIARPTDDSALDDAEAGMIIGTPDYQAPEQVEGKEPTPRSDIYALGLLIYETFTAKRPFDAETPTQRMLQRLDEEPPPLSEIRLDAPQALERVVTRCLRRNPDDRYPSATALLEELERLRA